MLDRVCVVYQDMLTAYGHGTACCMKALFENKTTFGPVRRFQSPADFPAVCACFPSETVPADAENPAELAVMYLLQRLPADMVLPQEHSEVFFALTQGEISQLENPEKIWTARYLVRRVMKCFPQESRYRIFSASCASGNVALARAAAGIESGKLEQAVVIGCDVVSEFTFAGFSSVHAVTPGVCRPYDIAHDGLLLGDAAGVIVLASENKARRCGWPILAVIEGYGITTDSFHAAAPDPEGVQMALAVRKVMEKIPQNTVGGIIGHGTGTALNDDMEIAALNRLFPEGVPLASIKGGTGHILAASGIIQAACAVCCLEKGMMIPQTSLQTPQKGAEKFVSNKAQELRGNTLLTLNAGFGGLNAVLGIGRYRNA